MSEQPTLQEALVAHIPTVIGYWPAESLVAVVDDGKSMVRVAMPLTASEYTQTLGMIRAVLNRHLEAGQQVIAVVAFTEFTQQARDIVGLMETEMNVRPRLALRVDAGCWSPLSSDEPGEVLSVGPADYL